MLFNRYLGSWTLWDKYFNDSTKFYISTKIKMPLYLKLYLLIVVTYINYCMYVVNTKTKSDMYYLNIKILLLRIYYYFNIKICFTMLSEHAYLWGRVIYKLNILWIFQTNKFMCPKPCIWFSHIICKWFKVKICSICSLSFFLGTGISYALFFSNSQVLPYMAGNTPVYTRGDCPP